MSLPASGKVTQKKKFAEKRDRRVANFYPTATWGKAIELTCIRMQRSMQVRYWGAGEVDRGEGNPGVEKRNKKKKTGITEEKKGKNIEKIL